MMSGMPRLLRYALLLLLSFGSAALSAQTAPPAATPAQTLDQLGNQLDSIKAALGGKDSSQLAGLRTAAIDVQDQARQLTASLVPQTSALQAQLDVLGPAPAAGATLEAPEVAGERRRLNRALASLDTQSKRAQLIGQNALQLAAQIAGMRNDQFQASLASRTPSPFSRAYWVDPVRTLPNDMVRLGRLASRYADAVKKAWQPPNRQPLLLCLTGAVLLVGVGRWLLERLLFALTCRHVPDGHLRRSAMAAAVALGAVLTTGLAAKLVHAGLNWNGILDRDLDALLATAVGLICLAAYITGLGRGLLAVSRPSWRLPALSDVTARRLRPFPWWLGAVVLVFGLFERISRTIGTSLAATVAARGLMALIISGLFGLALMRLLRSRRESRAANQADEPAQRPLYMGLLLGAAILGVLLSWLAVGSGFIALAFFVSSEMLWITAVMATAYLLGHLLIDTVDTLLSPGGRSGQRLLATFELNPRTLEQVCVVLTGVIRVILALLALALVLRPFGAGPSDLLTGARQAFGNLGGGVFPLNLRSLSSALLVLLAGLAVVRILKRWLHDELLPKSAMQPGMQESLTTLAGYLGGALVLALTLTTLHVDLKSITWILSALSVGIGFGLQAIVQNFISGLILLVERPVKAGDWVSLNGDVEGDIRRINVRATEIQMGDRSTVIVPNSQLITQNVRNVTLANAQGRVLIRLPMPLDTDAGKVRALALEILQEHPATLDMPVPSVQLDSLDGGSMQFSCVAYVSSPRQASAVKSDLLFELVDRLRAADLPLSSPGSMLIRTMPPVPDENTSG